MGEKRRYDPEIKAAVMAELLMGQSISKVATQYAIPKGTVGRWASEAGVFEKVATEKRENIADLIVAYLEANLHALRAQSVLFADRVWLEQQGASEAAVLHGVMTDKAVRLLEAFGRANDSDTNAGH